MTTPLNPSKQFVINTLRLERFQISRIEEKGWVPRYAARSIHYKVTTNVLYEDGSYQQADIPPSSVGMLFISLFPEHCDKIFFETTVNGAVVRFDVTRLLNTLDPVILDDRVQHASIPGCPLYAVYLSNGNKFVQRRDDGTRYFDYDSMDNFGMFTTLKGMEALEIVDLLTGQILHVNFEDPRFQLNPCFKIKDLLKANRLPVWTESSLQKAMTSLVTLTEKPAPELNAVLFLVYSWCIQTAENSLQVPADHA